MAFRGRDGRPRKQGVERYASGKIKPFASGGEWEVYFVRMPEIGLTKVGITNNWDRRESQLQNGSPYKLEKIAAYRAGDRTSAYEAEKYFHRVLKDQAKHAHGEWFRLGSREARELVFAYMDKVFGPLASNQEKFVSTPTGTR